MSKFLHKDFKLVFNAICGRLCSENIKIPGMALIGKGTTGKIWDLGNSFVFKVFYIGPQSSLPIPEQMKHEFFAYEKVQKYSTDADSPLPRIYSSMIFPDSKTEGRACGWAVLSKMPGKNLTFEEIEKLPDTDRNMWVSNFVKKVIRIEAALAKVPDPPELWKKGYTDSRFDLIRNKTPDVTKDEFEIVDALERILKSKTNFKNARYLHGDLNAKNILTDATEVYILDPLVSFDIPEANWRFLPPRLANMCAEKYEEITGYTSDPIAMEALRAATKGYAYLRNKSGPEAKDHLKLFNICLSKLGLQSIRPSLIHNRSAFIYQKKHQH